MKRMILSSVAMIAFGVVVSAQTGAPPQTPPQTPPPTPQFKSSIELVRLDVSVLDKSRQPVRGLTAADFTVLENGKPQQVSAFSAVEVPGPEPAPAPWMRDVAPDVRSNS